MTNMRPTSIMERIIRYERRRTRRWLVVFWLLIIAFVGWLALSIVSVVEVLRHRQSLQVLSIFTEDWEVIREGWFDAFRSIWTDVPRTGLLLIVAAVSGMAGLLIGSAHQRRIEARKRRSLHDLQPPAASNGRQ